ncbi:MAG TPA: nuclear transport factor 2 family protein [Solirubrobacteraceae bacterium]|nr:nuclear transport factor 2 family protein [Solirubrobacteraceae bacterium]
MSQENVERLRAVYADFNATGQVDLQVLTDDVEFKQPEVGESIYHGRDGVARGVRELFDVFEDVRAEPDEFFDAGAQIVVFVRLSGRARGSGASVAVPLAHVFRFRGQLIDRWHTYPDRQEALKAVGLEE